MTEIISVRFRPGGKQYYFDPAGLTVAEGQSVIVETGKGLEYGVCVRRNAMVEDGAVVQPLRPVVRLANERDERQVRENRGREKEALRTCQQLVERHGLDMKLVQVEYSFDGGKIIFFFTSDGRVDFRALVKDLAGIFRARIELRQIGVRDEARMLGGFGICGKPFCCAQFLSEFQPVSIKMAKTQNLSLNPTKISGTCGRLMCCLKFEQDAYEDLMKRAPKQESFVETPDGAGTVCGINLLRQTAQVRLESDPDSPRTYHNCELCVVRSGRGRRPEGYVEPPLEELSKLRRKEEESAPTAEDSLAAALEAAFPSREPREELAGEERRPNSRRNHRRRPKGEGSRPPQEAPEQSRRESDGQDHEEDRRSGGNHRRRRRRPGKSGGKGQD